MKRNWYRFYKMALLFYTAFAVLFYVVDIPLKLYLLILNVLLVLTCLLYPKSDRDFFEKILVEAGAGSLAFLSAKLLKGCEIRVLSETELKLAVCLLVLVTFLGSLAIFPLSEEQNSEPVELFREQEDDVNRLRRYIVDLPLIGINAKWGNGKSLVWTKLKEDETIRKNFEVIQIDLLACDLDSIELILLDQLEQILEQNGIYPKSSRHLKALLGQNKWLKWIGDLLGIGTSGVSASFDILQKDLSCMDKKILIGFEDIDRISEKASMKKIFALSEKLASENIHIVFQYNEDLLADAGLDHRYLEKYIPHTVTLTEMTYFGLVLDLWRKLGMDEIPVNRKSVLEIEISDQSIKKANELLGFYSRFPFEDFYRETSIRKVRTYLMDIRELYKSNPTLFSAKKQDITIRVLFVKHFFREVYDQFRVEQSIPREILCKDTEMNGARVPFADILSEYGNLGLVKMTNREKQKQQEKLESIFKEPENYKILSVILLLGYEIEYSDVHFQEYSIEERRKIEKNEKIDHVVWKVVANGTKEMTEAEIFANYLRKKVLNRPKKEWIKIWEIIKQNDVSLAIPLKFEKAKSSDAKFYYMFRAMYITENTEQMQQRLLSFYFYINNCENLEHVITYGMLCCFHYCNLSRKEDLLRAAKFFGSARAEKNPKNCKMYQYFLQSALRAVVRAGYCKNITTIIENVRVMPNTDAEKVLEMLQCMEESMKLTMEQKVENVNEYEIVRSFIAKNIELMQLPEEMAIDTDCCSF